MSVRSLEYERRFCVNSQNRGSLFQNSALTSKKLVQPSLNIPLDSDSGIGLLRKDGILNIKKNIENSLLQRLRLTVSKMCVVPNCRTEERMRKLPKKLATICKMCRSLRFFSILCANFIALCHAPKKRLPLTKAWKGAQGTQLASSFDHI